MALGLVALAPTAPVDAQDAPGKRPLQIADYRLWRTIDGAEISDDGRWVAWTYTKVRMDDTLHVRALDSDAGHRVANASGAVFSDDGRWIAYMVAPPFLEAEKLERDGEDVRRRVELMELASGRTRGWDGATSFAFATGSSHLLVTKEAAGRRRRARGHRPDPAQPGRGLRGADRQRRRGGVQRARHPPRVHRGRGRDGRQRPV
ncbi:MAG: hypothetical protein GWN07_37485, partial [Actinobacteria bacterium]|nr:hypothetical protein [Actinomycetota bacterium]